MQRPTEHWRRAAVALATAALVACSARPAAPHVLPASPAAPGADLPLSASLLPAPVPVDRAAAQAPGGAAMQAASGPAAAQAPSGSAAQGPSGGAPQATSPGQVPAMAADAIPHGSTSPPAAAVALPERPAAGAAAAALELLAFHERIREMSATELGREVARLGDPPAGPRAALALAIVLAQTHGAGDLLRALALVEPIARSTHPAAVPWQPFARWLAVRYAEQRRLEDQLERQTQQLREQQRRLDQLNEKLAALRAIERSLGRGPGGGNLRPPGSQAPR